MLEDAIQTAHALHAKIASIAETAQKAEEHALFAANDSYLFIYYSM